MDAIMQYWGTFISMITIAGVIIVGIPVYRAAKKREAAAAAQTKNNQS